MILASGSPQRRAILEQLGVEFRVVVSDVPELEAGPPEEVVRENAYRKAAAVAAGYGLGSDAGKADAAPLVLGADTIVALGRHIYGKPADADDARATLEMLSGREHRVLSGVCVIQGEAVHQATAVTSVIFRTLDAATLDWYLATEEWRDRAGAYAIQARGAALVTEIRGDYLNVVGLPVPTLLELLPNLLRRSAM